MRAIRFLGSGLSQQLGPVCDARERASAAQALRLALRESPHRWDLFIASDLPAEEGWHDLLGGLRVRATPSPALRLVGSSWREFLACRSANFRRQVGREERRLAQSYDVRFRMADYATRLDADLDMLFALHTARWGRAASAAFAAVERFHRELAALACERGWLRLRFLELDGRPAAALYGFRFADAEWFFQSGRDPSLTRYSPGFVLLARAVREAIASDRARPTSRRIRRGSRTGCRTRRSGPT